MKTGETKTKGDMRNEDKKGDLTKEDKREAVYLPLPTSIEISICPSIYVIFLFSLFSSSLLFVSHRINTGVDRYYDRCRQRSIDKPLDH